MPKALLLPTLFLLLSATLHAQIADTLDRPAEPIDSSFGALFVGGLIDVTREIDAIARAIHSVEDAEAAEGRIGRALDGIADRLDFLLTNFDSIAAADSSAIVDPAVLMYDPRIGEVAAAAEQAMVELEGRDPLAAFMYQQMIEEGGERYAVLMGELILKVETYLGLPDEDDDEDDYFEETEGEEVEE